ncbi:MULTISPECIES: transcriptional regulator [unclassified Streptomyces]|uniref:Helix-turn-helix domain-containing protein n=1 Tax=Streptomyces sp. NBC_00119 TaxID=2975659 RepID=A0AAU1UE20_9ACTN|nr:MULTISPECIES: helix-turn-helix domain-containing protein [unclassified Streptomyces]MCX4646033.1 helix-turn-helix domain-containing protein [Streptomyces sp. NBC_01446]MCX5318657.1 helix-turn-helix domain-containing protein [Streptomyces sp. NBC_00120]
MTDERTRRITDLGTLKALAHPLRSQLYRALVVARTATASQLAERVDGAVSLVSYHLRKLADAGLIEEAPGAQRDGRERWWQPASDGVSIHEADFGDAPEKAAAHRAATRLFYEQRSELYRRYLDERSTWAPEWRAASSDSEALMPLTAAELTELTGELLAVIRKYDEQGRAAQAAGDTEGRESVALHMYGFPFRA